MRLRSAYSVAFVLSCVVAAIMTVASVYALFAWRSVYDGADPKLVPLLVGQDALNLLVALPMLLVSLLLARRGSLIGMLLWPGALFYIAYDYGYYVLGAPYNAFFLPYIALVTVSLYGAALAVASVDRSAVRDRVASAIPARTVGGFLAGIAILFTLLWTALNVSTLASGNLVDPVVRVVTVMDLVLQLPALFVVGVLLWRGEPFGYVAAPGLLLQAATYLAGLSVITLLTEDVTGAAFEPVAILPGFAIGIVGLFLVALFVRAANVQGAAPAKGPRRLGRSALNARPARADGSGE